MDKHAFFLNMLYETSRELSTLVQPRKILDTFLLMSMGSLGLGSGFAALVDRNARQGAVLVRGLPPGEVERLEENLPTICDRFFAGANSAAVFFPLPQLLARDEPGACPELFPAEMQHLVVWTLDERYAGFIGVGSGIDGAPPGRETTDQLMQLCVILTGTLANALATQHVRSLNAGLQRRNEELQRTIDALTRARTHIDLLEKARMRVKSLAERELARSGTARPLDFVLIGLVALVIGIMFNWANPGRVPLLPEALGGAHRQLVDVVRANALLTEEDALMVDARPREFFESAHVPGAINLPPSLFDIVYMMRFASLDPERPIIVYGRTISRLYDEMVAHRLIQRDHERVLILDGGMRAWERNGYPLEK